MSFRIWRPTGSARPRNADYAPPSRHFWCHPENPPPWRKPAKFPHMWIYARIVFHAVNRARSSRRKLFGFLSPIVRSMVVRTSPFLRSVSSKLRWRPGITSYGIILREIQNSRKTPPNLESPSTNMIPGAPLEQMARSKSHFRLPFLAFVLLSFFRARRNDYRGTWESTLYLKKCCEIPKIDKIHPN